MSQLEELYNAGPNWFDRADITNMQNSGDKNIRWGKITCRAVSDQRGLRISRWG